MFDVVIVAFHPQLHELAATLDALVAARETGLDLALQLWHNDGGVAATPGLADALDRARQQGLTVEVRGGQGNLGFGRIEASELAASAQYVAATASAKVDIHMASAEGVLKRVNRRV